MASLKKLQDRPRMNTFGTGPGMFVHDDFMSSLAFRSLKPKEKLVLLAMMRAYEKASAGDRNDLSSVGFVFTYSMCAEHCDARSFYGKKGREPTF